MTSTSKSDIHPAARAGFWGAALIVVALATLPLLGAAAFIYA